MMHGKRPVSSRKRFIRLTLIFFGVLALILFGLHIWFVNNARSLMQDIVYSKSKGKLKLELSQLSFNFLSNDLQVKGASLVSTDSTTAATSYRVVFGKLSVRVGSFWPLLFKNQISIDSIEVEHPQVTVTQWRIDTAKKGKGKELSIPRQMGQIYNSMLDGLDAFGIQRILISNASMRLVNKINEDEEPVFISHINFNLVRTAEAEGSRDEYIPDARSVELTTTNQDIALPGGRHRLAFSRFSLNLFNKRIQLDSCTVTATSGDTLNSNYTIFFDKLLLSGVDFNAMYAYNLIKADSVYCDNPQFEININTLAAKKGKGERPDPNKIIQELTGDLDLAYVGVKSAGIHINITGKTTRSLFNSNKDDFEMYGLRINADSSRPVVVNRFAMLVRDYHLYNEDSSSAYTFDSIQFLNNKITLNNFSVVTSSSPDQKRSERDFRIPYFELTGLDWYQLIFEENLVAKEAVLYNPVIRFVNRSPKKAPKGKKTDIFRSLRLVDELITVGKISVVNGQINMVLGPQTSLDIQNANLSLNNTEEGYSELRQAVSRLSFSSARIKVKEITAIIHNADYSGKELVHAERVSLSTTNNSIKGTVNNVFINNLLVDENSERIVIDGLKWSGANINLQNIAAQKKKKATDIQLTNIRGDNTTLHYSSGSNKITTAIQSFRLASLLRTAGGMQVKGLEVKGSNFQLKGEDLSVTASGYDISSDRVSQLLGIAVSQVKGRDTLLLNAPRLQFSATADALLSGDMAFATVDITQPVLRVNNWNNDTSKKAAGQIPTFSIAQVNMQEPDIRISINKNDSFTIINMPSSPGNTIAASRVQADKEGLKLGTLSIHTNSATLVKKTGEVVGVEKGKVDVELSNLQYLQGESPSWAVVVNSLHLKNPNQFSIGKNKNSLQLSETSIGNLSLSSGSVTDVAKLLKENVSAWVRTTTGHYIDSTTTMRWFNADYNSGKKTLSLDSFQYHPTQPLDSVIARTPFQTDYITVKTGNVLMKGFSLDRFEKDSSLIADTIQVDHPVITIYRDKLPPFLAGNLKPLPVEMLANINMPVHVKGLKLVDGLLQYTERNAKSRAEGTLSLVHLNAEVSNLKNRDHEETDSMTITMNAYLMDSAWIGLRVRESYTDSLKGFLMTLQMRPTSLSFLNPVVVPLSNVRITSGTIDSFHVRAIGRSDLAIGEMKMYYHDLRIQMVKGGDSSKTGLGGRIVSFLANTFLIRKNNKGRTGIVYLERDRDRSFFNYLVKMTFSGMATSIGIKKNKKYLRQYKKELRERNLPEVVF